MDVKPPIRTYTNVRDKWRPGGSKWFLQTIKLTFRSHCGVHGARCNVWLNHKDIGRIQQVKAGSMSFEILRSRWQLSNRGAGREIHRTRRTQFVFKDDFQQTQNKQLLSETIPIIPLNLFPNVWKVPICKLWVGRLQA